MAQRDYPDELVLYLDLEQAVDLDYAQKLGVDITDDKFLLIQPDSRSSSFNNHGRLC